MGRREGITDDLVAALSDYERGPFTDRERAALRYADRMYDDHHDVDDALWTQLRAHFGDDELLELSWAIAEFIALGKIISVVGLPYGSESCDAASGAAVGLAGQQRNAPST